jgi:hypothetical protein
MPKPKIWGDSNLKGAVAIGIDQSYSGFAMTAIDDDDNYYTEVWKLEGNGVERLRHAQLVLGKFLEKFLNIKGTAIEGYAFGSQMANMLGELGGAVKLTLYYTLNEPDCFPLIVPPTSLKKYITGKGTGVKKNQVLLSVYKKWGVEFTDDNAADSYGLARLVRNKHDFEYEKEIYDKLTSPGK